MRPFENIVIAGGCTVMSIAISFNSNLAQCLEAFFLVYLPRSCPATIGLLTFYAS